MSDKNIKFNVQVEFMREESWKEVLRFMAQTMSADDPYLDFIVSLWSYSIKNNGLTEKQAASIEKFSQGYLDKFYRTAYQVLKEEEGKKYTGNVVSIDGGKNDNK